MTEEGGFKKLIFGFILTSLFSLLILTSVVNFGQTYNKDTSQVAGGSLSIAGFNNSINEVQDTSENLRENFEKQSIWSSVAGVVVTGIFDIAKAMFLMIILPFTLIANVMIDVLHIPVFVINVMLGLLILTGIFGIWRLVKMGS